MSYPRSVIEEIRMNNDIVDVIGESVNLKPQSGGFVGLCPFHHEKTPSFRVNPREQYFKCFGCGEAGDVISFVMKSRNFAFSDAVKHLANRINYPLPEESFSADYKRSAQERQDIYEINKKAARFFYDNLQSSEGFLARQYLDNRKISQKTRTVYGLGYASYKKGSAADFLSQQGYSKEIMLKSGLVTEKNGKLYDKFFNRLMFPIIDIHNRIIAFGGRVLDDGVPKYLNSPETPVFHKSDNLYSINFAIKERKRELILVEGYMDVISLYQAGFRNAVAALGTGFNADHTKLLKKYADTVILLFDSDDAGVKAVLRAIPVLKGAGIQTKVLQVQNAKDPDEYIKSYGAQAFAELLKTALPATEFKLMLERGAKDLSNIEDKLNYTKSAVNIIADIDNEIERDVYIKRLADETNVDTASIKSELNKKNTLIAYNNKRKLQNTAKNNAKSGLESAKKGIINIISNYPYVYEKISDVFKSEYFKNNTLTKLYNIVTELISGNKPVYAAEVVNYFEEPEIRDQVMNILINNPEYENKQILEKNVNDYIKLILTAYLSDEIKSSKDVVRVKSLIESKKNVTKLHISLA